MLPSIRERLSTWIRQTEQENEFFGHEIQSFSIEVRETAPGHGAQKDFFHSREAQAESWDSLLARLTEKIGVQGRFQARPIERHLPEKSWDPGEPLFFHASESDEPQWTLDTRGTSSTDDAERLPATRPTRLLRESVLLEHRAGWLHWPDENHPGKRQRVHQWIGPERLSEGWWECRNLEARTRDYFRVICANGTQLWGYFENSTAEFHLQGYFD